MYLVYVMCTKSVPDIPNMYLEYLEFSWCTLNVPDIPKMYLEYILGIEWRKCAFYVPEVHYRYK